MKADSAKPHKSKVTFLSLLRWSPVLLIFVMFGSCIWRFYDPPRASVNSRIAWYGDAMHHIASALCGVRDRGIRITDGPYWGPMTPQMARRIGVDEKYLIDPYNLDDPESKWLIGPKYRTDRGWPVRIKGNPLWVYSNGSNFLMFVGRGYNQVQEITREDARNLETNHLSTEISAKFYDPTNGTFSGGDYMRVEVGDRDTSPCAYASGTSGKSTPTK